MSLRELLDNATPGPWRSYGPLEYGDCGVMSKDGRFITTVDWHDKAPADAALIVYLRNHAEAMERVIEAARENSGDATAGLRCRHRGYG